MHSTVLCIIFGRYLSSLTNGALLHSLARHQQHLQSANKLKCTGGSVPERVCAKKSGPQCSDRKNEKALLPTFEEHKLPLAVLVHGVDLGWQTLPEVVDLHGVTGHH